MAGYNLNYATASSYLSRGMNEAGPINENPMKMSTAPNIVISFDL